MGLFEVAAFEQESVQLDRGDIVLLFSDGVSEAMNKTSDGFGDDRLLDVALGGVNLPLETQVERIVEAVREFTVGAPQSDDITVTVIRYLGHGTPA